MQFQHLSRQADCADQCAPLSYKFWYWDVKLQTEDTLTGAKSPWAPDFHIVGGQSDNKGKGPGKVMSKNGARPLEGPGVPTSFAFKAGPAPDTYTGLPHPRFNWNVKDVKLSCYCSPKLP
jgi:hypothetical protein